MDHNLNNLRAYPNSILWGDNKDNLEFYTATGDTEVKVDDSVKLEQNHYRITKIIKRSKVIPDVHLRGTNRYLSKKSIHWRVKVDRIDD